MRQSRHRVDTKDWRLFIETVTDLVQVRGGPPNWSTLVSGRTALDRIHEDGRLRRADLMRSNRSPRAIRLASDFLTELTLDPPTD